MRFPTREERIARVMQQVALEGFRRPGPYTFPSSPALARIQALGSQLWVDSGDLEAVRPLWRRELSALTTNNTLANQVVQTGIMDPVVEQAQEALQKEGLELCPEEMVQEIGFVINCRIALNLVQAFGARVSVELHPDMAHDVETSLRYGRRYHQVAPEWFLIKVPLTPEGLLISRQLVGEGIPVNLTLGFSARQNYLAAHLARPDYLNVFLGRLNAVVQDNQLGSGHLVGERATQATQQMLDSLRNQSQGIRSRLIAASIRSSEQVATLAGIDVLTIPPGALQGFLEAEPAPASLRSVRERSLEVDLLPEHRERVEILWKVDEGLRKAVQRLMEHPEGSLTGEAIVAHFEKEGIPLFTRFSSEQDQRLREAGKTPRLSDWDPGIPLDDLMTRAALQSFARDQEALDARIRRLLGLPERT